MTEIEETIKEMYPIGLCEVYEYKMARIAIEALEKQVPKTLEYAADGYSNGELVYDYAKCPICGHDFEYGINDWGCKYCSDCGQKLDWSDEE